MFAIRQGGRPRRFFPLWVIIFLVSSMLLQNASCTSPGPDADLQGTISALNLQLTQGAIGVTQTAISAPQGTELAAQSAAPPQNSPAPDLVATSVQATLAAQPPPPAEPTFTTQPPTAVPPVEIEGPTSPDVEEKIRSARILLYESMSGQVDPVSEIGYVRFVKKALEEDPHGYSFTDVGSAKGWFMEQLISLEEWDLIIAAGESATPITGEFYKFIHTHLQRGAAVVLELWRLDDLSNGDLGPILDECGVELYADWYDPPLRSLWWLAPEHPLLHEPNELGPSLRNFHRFWSGDIGDLMQIKTYNNQVIGDAELLAGTQALSNEDHATLASCMDGRLILQTFRTHEYDPEDVVKLWQNSIYYTLKNHFEAAQ